MNEARTHEADGIEPGKIFVGGLSWDTTKETLKKYFEEFGTVTDCVIMEDPATKNPRGFGFVTFEDPASVKAVINHPVAHMLDNKKIDPKQATLKGGVAIKCKKIFVGGLSFDTTIEDLAAHFKVYGVVLDAEIKKDRDTDKRRGFGFVDFDDELSVEKACATQFQVIKGKSVEVKKAEPQKKDKRQNQGNAAGYTTYPPSSGRGGYGQAASYPQYAGYPPQAQPYHYPTTGYSPQSYPSQYPYQHDYPGMQQTYARGFTGQHPQMSSYPHDSSYSQPRSGYGQTGDNYASGNYAPFDHGSGSYTTYQDSMGSGGANAYGRGNSQRSSYSYGGR